MGDEGFEEWDADFLDQLIQVEELALTSTNPSQHHRLPQPPSLPQISYSPPRELSQRVTDANTKHPDPSLADSAPFVAPFRDPYGEEIERWKRVRDGNAKHPERSLAGPAPFIAPSRIPNEQEIERLKVGVVFYFFPPGRGLLGFWINGLEFYLIRGFVVLRGGYRESSAVFQSSSLTCYAYCEALMHMYGTKEFTIATALSLTLTASPMGWLEMCVGASPAITQIKLHLEQDCLQLRNERDKKEEQLKSVYSKIEAKEAEVQCRKSKILYVFFLLVKALISVGVDNWLILLMRDHGVHTHDHPVISLGILNDNSSNDRGGSRDNLAKASTISLAVERSDVGFQDQKPAFQSAEAAKVSHLYSMLTKIDAGMVKLEALFEALVDLCSLKDDVIVYRSLRVLRMVLNHTVDLRRGLYIRSLWCTVLRDNVIVEGPSSSINSADACELKTESLFSVGADDMSGSGLISSRTRLFDEEILWKDQRNLVSAVSTSCLDWGSVVELMHQIAMKNIEECVRVEAVAIMNMILMRSNAYLDREKFARLLAFESISHLLRKGSGLSVQKQAVRLLYLLLNCPKVMAMFCSFCEEAECSGAANIDAKNASSQGFSVIMEGLEDCVACGGNGTQVLVSRVLCSTSSQFVM
ncbi:hypothetical protein RHMOL_Rhmol07G0161500 [Rhododendron molle]|uniref:Uncharacterized protein n=1 Tax=Rhododendron molle TaxID=49168 RepID=A0ACC0N1F9_RHOML|nr:hypothetical protein RHMOL_Rhmol07G0161500 [Rhododendron molle]